jgi:cell fate regulator YaaT (PSP1 superfamily)
VQIAQVNLPFNIKTLWFDPDGLDIKANDRVVVQTVRGIELGVAASDLIEVGEEELKRLKSPLKKVLRLATPEDIEQNEKNQELARVAMADFKVLAEEHCPSMHPVSVEYLLDGDKAIFYFESEKRIDFRELVRLLAAKFKIRIDMRQMGVRDEARIIGGIGHCGQEVCCKRLGGEFKPVSIRMAKDQDLSLNPQKISGLCGRLMCCLRYEDEAYRDFKANCPKVGACVCTTDGVAKVVDINVPRETIKLKLDEEKPVVVSASAIENIDEGKWKYAVEDEAWEEAKNPHVEGVSGMASIFQTAQLTGVDKLGTPTAVHHERSGETSHERKRRERRERNSGRGGAYSQDRASARFGSDAGEGELDAGQSKGSRRGSRSKSSEPKRTPRRRSTKILADGTTQVEQQRGAESTSGDGARAKVGDAQARGGAAPSVNSNKSRSEQKQSKHSKQKAQKSQGAQGGSASREVRSKQNGFSSGSQGARGSQGSNGNSRPRPGQNSSALKNAASQDKNLSSTSAGGNARPQAEDASANKSNNKRKRRRSKRKKTDISGGNQNNSDIVGN